MTHLCPKSHCNVTANDGGMERLGLVCLCEGFGGRTGVGFHIFSIFCSAFVLLLNVLS